jgi:hypothetical protein
MSMVRQGDVLLVPVDTVPEYAAPVSPDGGIAVLALGEATGHAHVIRNERAVLFSAEDVDEVFLRVHGSAPVTLSHEEHDPLPVAPGAYRVVRQREYQPGAVATRTVAD